MPDPGKAQTAPAPVKRRLSIKNRIFLYNFAIILISLTAVSYFSNRVSTNAIIEKAQANSFRELALISNNLDHMVENINNYSVSLSIDYRLQQLLKDTIDSPASTYNKTRELVRIVTSIKGLNNNISSSEIMTVDHRLFEIGEYGSQNILKLLTDDLIVTANKDKTPLWIGPYLLKNTYGQSEDAFLVVKAVTDLESPTILGTVIYYVKERGIASIYLNNMNKGNVSFFILDGNNRVVSSSMHEKLHQDFRSSVSLSPETMDRLISKRMVITTVNDKQSLITLLDFEKLDWKIVSIVPMEEITKENKAVNRMIVNIGVLCLAVALVVSFILSRSISQPILKLVRIMKKIRQGDMDIRTNFHSSDEIGQLGSGFDTLIDRIEELMATIVLEQKSKRESEFLLLQSQIKPHFLYNTLETISSLIKLGMKDHALTSIQSLASFYRISLSGGRDIIPLEKEFELIDSYLRIQKFRYMNYVDFNIEIEKSILPYSIPKLTLQPLVENAIYHGLKQKKTKGVISVKGYRNGDLILVEVFDNGVGMTEEKIRRVLTPSDEAKESRDFGLGSVNSRIRLFFGEPYGISIISIPGEYTKVTVSLPMKIGEGDQHAEGHDH